MLVPVAAAAWLIWRDLAPSGQFIAVNDLKHYYPYVSPLYPVGRLGEPVKDGNLWKRQVKAEPVYFDVRLPRRMNEAKVSMLYATNGPSPRLGLKIGKGTAWQYDIQSLSIGSDSSNGTFGEAIFSLTHAAIENGRLRFIISAPAINEPKAVLEIKRIEIKLTGEKLRLADLAGIARRKIDRLLEYVRQL